MYCSSWTSVKYRGTGTSISEQLKKNLDKATSLIALITKDSLRSTWVLFELGSSWATGKIVVPILGPGISDSDLPGPLKEYLGVQIEDDQSRHLMLDAIYQLGLALDIHVEINGGTSVKLDEFLKEFKAWKSPPDPYLSQQEKIEYLTQKLELQERSHTQQLEELEQSYQTQIAEKESEINRSQELIEQLLKLNNKRGVDYTKLHDHLAAGEWKDADEETVHKMLEVANRQKQGYLDVEDIDNFPCEDLRTIDQLWVHYSNGRFGFSVQKNIYLGLGGTREYEDEIWKTFGYQVGWRKGKEWMKYSGLTFELRNTTLEGHFPVWTGEVIGRWDEVNRLVIGMVLLSRTDL